VPRARLEAAVGDADAQWLGQLAAGVDLEEVKECRLPQSISCGKTFRGPTQLRALPAVHRWLLELGRCGPRPRAPARAWPAPASLAGAPAARVLSSLAVWRGGNACRWEPSLSGTGTRTAHMSHATSLHEAHKRTDRARRKGPRHALAPKAAMPH
jgi:hypothetical protein